MKRLKNVLISAGFLLASMSSMAQVKIGDNPTTINANSVLEVESTNKGLLLPRVALTGTANVAPLAAHVAGMTVYNTATAGDVTPGYYYNTGTAWSRIATGGASEWKYEPAINSILAIRPLATGDTVLIKGNTGQVFVGQTIRGNDSTVTKFRITAENDFSRALDGAAIDKTSATGVSLSGIWMSAIYEGTGSASSVFGVRGVSNAQRGSGNISTLVGTQGWSLIRTGYTGTVDNQYALLATIANQGSVGAATNVVGVEVSAINSTTAAGLNRYGLRIGGVVRSTYQPGGVAYAIYTNAGTVSLGDTLALRGGNIIQGETTTRAATNISLNPRGGNVFVGGNMEVSNFDSGDRTSFIDFHASNAIDFNTRVSRGAGINGDFNITNTGTGRINLSSATGSLSVLSNGDVVQTAKGYLQVATGTTAERPATAVAGMIRFNTTLVKFEGYDGTAWQLLN